MDFGRKKLSSKKIRRVNNLKKISIIEKLLLLKYVEFSDVNFFLKIFYNKFDDEKK